MIWEKGFNPFDLNRDELVDWQDAYITVLKILCLAFPWMKTQRAKENFSLWFLTIFKNT